MVRTRLAALGVMAMAFGVVSLPSISVAQGKAPADVYGDKCAVCHGADGAGKTAKGKKLKVKDVRETAAKLSAAQMADIVKNGKAPDMDAFGKELGDQIPAIVDYYRSLAKK